MFLRAASPADVPALARFASDAFCAAFAHLYRPEDLNAFLAEAYDEGAIAAELAGPQCLFRLAVGDAGDILGFAKLRRPSKLAPYSDAVHPIELGQLYVAPDRTSGGIGAALMDWTLDEARAGGHDAILLSVYSGNPGAQRFYARYGFAKIADITFRVGQQLDDEYLFEMKMPGDT